MLGKNRAVVVLAKDTPLQGSTVGWGARYRHVVDTNHGPFAFINIPRM